MNILTSVSEAAFDSRLLECKSFALAAKGCVFVVNLHTYGPAFEDTATNPVTLSVKKGGGEDLHKGKESTHLLELMVLDSPIKCIPIFLQLK